jgi:negative regulator of flagellin synthesis FlgM
MKINGFITDVLSKYDKQAKSLDKTDVKKSSRSDVSVKDKSPKELDKVEISSNAKALSQLGESDSERAVRIEQVKAAVNHGSYKPNIDEIAKALLKEWKNE